MSPIADKKKIFVLQMKIIWGLQQIQGLYVYWENL